MVSRDQRDPTVLQKVRKQGIDYKSLIPTFDKHTVMTNKPKVGD